MAWRLTLVTFSGEIFFLSKEPEFLHVLFNYVVNHTSVFFGWFAQIVSEKNEDKILKRAQWRRQSGTRAFSFVVLCIIAFGTRGIFFPFMLFFKKFRHCWREKFTWKSHLGQSCFFSKTKCKPAKKQCRGMFTTKLAVPKIIRELGRVRASFKF